MMNARYFGPLLLTLGTLATGCAGPGTQRSDPLPFHIAVMPVTIELAQLPAPIDDGKATDVGLSFENGNAGSEMLAALEDSFVKVTQLSPLPAGGSVEANRDAWLREARDKGADLILQSTLSYQEDINTSFNDRFWLNLPLYTLGGPFCWFVNDRTYYFDVRLQADFLDVSAGLDESDRAPDPVVLPFDRQVREASLDFMDRADGVGDYALGVLIPAGFIAKGSEEVPPELERAVSLELGGTLARSLRSRSSEVIRGKLVDFYPRNVQVVRAANGPHLEGEFVLEFGNAEELVSCGYRFAPDQSYRNANLRDLSPPQRNRERKGLKRYSFRIPLSAAGADEDTVQLQVTQDDFFQSTRTFTYSISANERGGKDHAGLSN